MTLRAGHSRQRAGSPPPLPGFLNSLAGPLDHYGYWAIALLLLLENIGVPVVPGEFAMIAGAIFAGTGRAGLNVVVVGIVALSPRWPAPRSAISSAGSPGASWSCATASTS